MANTIIIKDLLMKETIALLDEKLVITQFTNRAFTGELKKQGDTVTVQTFPNLTITTGGTAGADINAQTFAIVGENLTVDQVAQANVTITDAEELRSNLDLRSNVSERLSYQLAKLYDSFVGGVAIAGAANSVSTAALSKSNIFAEVEKMKVELAIDNADSDVSLFVLPQVASLIRQAPEWDGFKEGADMRIAGYVGKMSGMRIYETNNLPTLTMFAMSKDAVNFVEQMNGFKVTDAVAGFRSSVLLETLYGAKVFAENAKKICKHVYTLA